MAIEIYALVHGKYHDCKRYVSSVFCDYITYSDMPDGTTWFVAWAGTQGVLSGELTCLHGKGNKTFEFIRDLR